MLRSITFSFPHRTAAEREFFAYLTLLLQESPQARVTTDGLHLTASEPEDSLPATVIRPSVTTPFPQVQFDADGNLPNLIESLQPAPHNPRPLPTTIKRDAHGEYIAAHAGQETFYRLSLPELYKRLHSHLVAVDHTGWNIPSIRVPRKTWQQLLDSLAEQCNLYAYPGGFDWPFIIPATAQEFTHEITRFMPGRLPRFELVYEDSSPVPMYQFDIETDLPRASIEQLFPAPYGLSFPDVADYFRSVFVQHPWAGLAIRFDIRFKSTGPASDWTTGKWLVERGKRLQRS